MSLRILPQVCVQPDWHEAVRDVVGQTTSEESFWLSCYKKDCPSVHGGVSVKRGDTPRSAVLEGKDGVAVQQIDSRSFKVSCESISGIKDVMVFAPKTEFRPLSKRNVAAVAVSPDGKLYATGQGTDIVIGDLPDGKTQRILQGHISDVTVVQFFPSNQVLLSGACDFQARIWSVLDGSNPVTLKGHTASITDTAIISRGRNVLTSSRDGSIRLWHCGSASTIAVVCKYSCPINQIVLAPLPTGYEPASFEQLDEREVETSDKLVLAALGDGTVRGIHLGTKQELFSTTPLPSLLSSLAYSHDLGLIVTGDTHGVCTLFTLDALNKPAMQWQRTEHSITSLLIKLDQNGEAVITVASADGSIYQTNSISSVVKGTSELNVAVEYTGNELEAVNSTKTIPSAGGYQRILCGVRDGSVKIY